MLRRYPLRVVSWPLKRAAALALLASTCTATLAAEPVDFNRDIRPILSDKCFACHGPDKSKRQGELRLDHKAGAFAKRDEGRTIVPGQASASLLYQRIASADEDERMPPVDSGRSLSAEQIELIGRWIDQGATWQGHWAFIAPARPALPQVRRTDLVHNAIDAFVLARLEERGLSPSPQADKTTLIRRVTLDLTGLPPTPAEVDAFLADDSPDAYERLVDRLLASPRFGERMARPWLDAARYADTNGYQTDGPRHMWRWRDWVIEAINEGMPFDRFTVEQLAGDLLPGATLEQRIATGFHRNHRGNSEGGIIPEEFAVEYVTDRVETTATVWLGLTVGCARCHDHKFDPFTQTDYYRLFAYFNNLPEHGRAIKEGNSPPAIKAPTREQRARLKTLKSIERRMTDTFERLAGRLDDAQKRWEKSLDKSPPIDWSVRRGLVAHYKLNDSLEDATDSTKPGSAKPGSFTDGNAAYVAGRLGRAGRFDGKRFIDAGDVAKFGYFDKFSLAAWIKPTGTHGGTIVSRMVDVEREAGYSVSLTGGKVHVNLVKRWLDDSIRVETRQTLQPDRWHHVAVTYDGSRVAAGIKVYCDGRPVGIKVNLDEINQSFDVEEPLRIGGGGGPKGRFHGLIDEVRVYSRVLSPQQAAIVATPQAVTEIVNMPAAKRSAGQAIKLRTYFLHHHAPKHIQQLWRSRNAAREELAQYVESIPTVMVMQERPTPREAFVLLRGQYDKPGQRVTRGVPAALSSLPQGAPNNRLGLARWLVDPSNPLTARVTVNRLWQMYFGAGLVKTTGDFGSQGQWPTHPRLLDWLATEFVRSGWDMKAICRRMVTSATYRQRSTISPELGKIDPNNKLLARAPRLRLSAEMVRDQALAASGMLVEHLGGPSVKPYQPLGLWKEVSGEEYPQGAGENLYRRSLYTYFKRTVAPPLLATFDSSGREACTVRQTRTNTPLQALTLMNDVTFVEAARGLAQRVMTEEGGDAAKCVTLAFRLVMARRPSAAELGVLLSGYRFHLARFRADGDAATKLVSIGELARDETLDVAELAALATVSSLILNLDEAITRE